LGVLYSVWASFIAGNTIDMQMLLFGLAVGLPVVIAFTILLSRGYGWVRHVWSALWVFHLLFIEATVKIWIAGPWMEGVSGIAGEVTIAAALVLSYSPTSRAWFRAMRNARGSRL
jgi:hypothetical protein